MSDKQVARLRRIRRSRSRIFKLGTLYLSVYRTPNHIYAQVFAPRGTEVLASASSLDKEIRNKKLENGKIGVAEQVGKLVATRAAAKGITKVAFDRSGYKFHGRVKALAEAARTHGLQC